MARSWAEFLGDAEGPYETQEAQRSFVGRLRDSPSKARRGPGGGRCETQEAQRSFVGRLRDSLSKSRRALTEQLAVAAFDPADDGSWERLEEALIQGDVGVP